MEYGVSLSHDDDDANIQTHITWRQTANGTTNGWLHTARRVPLDELIVHRIWILSVVRCSLFLQSQCNNNNVWWRRPSCCCCSDWCCCLVQSISRSATPDAVALYRRNYFRSNKWTTYVATNAIKKKFIFERRTSHFLYTQHHFKRRRFLHNSKWLHSV